MDFFFLPRFSFQQHLALLRLFPKTVVVSEKSSLVFAGACVSGEKRQEWRKLAAPVCAQFEVADVSHSEGSYLLGSCEASRCRSACHLPPLSLSLPLAAQRLRPVIRQFAIASNIPIRKTRLKNNFTACSHLKSQCMKTLERALDIWTQLSVENSSCFHLWMAITVAGVSGSNCT